MIASRVNLTLVGAFVVAGVVSLVVALALLAGRTGPTERYYTVYANVANLKYGSQVMFQGFPVGQVERIEPVEEQGRTRFRVEFSVRRGWKIPEDSIARSVATGVLAPQTIAITAGDSARMLSPGDRVMPGESLGLMESLAGVAGSVDDIKDAALLPLLDNINRQVTLIGELFDEDVRRLLVSAEHAVDGLPPLLQHVTAAAESLDATAAQLRAVLGPEQTDSLQRIIAGADDTVQSLQRISSDLETLTAAGGDDLLIALQELRLTAEALSRHADSIAMSLDAAARNAQEFTRQVRARPGALLRGGASPDEPAPPLRRAEEHR